MLGVALIAQAWRMKDYSLNVSIARERQDDDPEMLRNRYFGATEVRFWSVAWICTGLLAQAGWVADDRRLAESRKREKPAFAGSSVVPLRGFEPRFPP